MRYSIERSPVSLCYLTHLFGEYLWNVRWWSIDVTFWQWQCHYVFEVLCKLSNCQPSLNIVVTIYTIFTTLLPSTSPARLFALIFPSGPLLLSSSSHQPNKKSRAMSLNQGVKELPMHNNINKFHRLRFVDRWWLYQSFRTWTEVPFCLHISSPESRWD